MKILSILESIVLEATPDQIYDSYYKDIPLNTFRQIVLSDPGTLKDGQEIKKIGKYSKLLLSMFKNGNLKIEDLPKANEYLSYVYKHRVPLDFNKIKKLVDIYEIVKKFYIKDTKNMKEILRALGPEDFDVVFKDEKWTIFIPKTQKGACYLGVNTQWCTTWGEMSLNPDHKNRKSHYENYKEKGTLYIIINNSDLNEKYQLHFESKQYMDVDDNRFNTGDFFEKNENLRNFFFPSFIKTNLSENEINEQIGKIDILSSSDSTNLITRIFEKTLNDNQLINSIISEDSEEINKLIIDDKLVKDMVDVKGNYVVFYFDDELFQDMEQIKDLIMSYERDKEDSWERIYYDFDDDVDYVNNLMEGFFKKYYDEKKSELKKLYNIINYENFKSEFFYDFLNNEDLYESVKSQYVNINIVSYENNIQNEIDGIEKYISFGTTGGTSRKIIFVNLGYFILYLNKKNIKSISNNLGDVLEGFSSFYNIDHEYEGFYDYHRREVKYEDVSSEIENYFDPIFDEYDKNKHCSDLRKKLNDIVEKLFKGETTLENEISKIEIPSLSIDCENESIFIKYTNKQTGKSEEGHVKVENLPSYVNNYKLFENVLSFKKYLLM